MHNSAAAATGVGHPSASDDAVNEGPCVVTVVVVVVVGLRFRVWAWSRARGGECPLGSPVVDLWYCLCARARVWWE